MSEPQSTPPPSPQPGFPYFTVVATLATLFLFLGLVLLAYNPNILNRVLGSRTSEVPTQTDPVKRLNELRARNQAVLDGEPNTGVKMSVADATSRIVADAERTRDDNAKHGRLPFPVEPPPAPKAK